MHGKTGKKSDETFVESDIPAIRPVLRKNCLKILHCRFLRFSTNQKINDLLKSHDICFTVPENEFGAGRFALITDENAKTTGRMNLSVSRNSVPEPGTLALLGAGFVGMVALRRRKSS